MSASVTTSANGGKIAKPKTMNKSLKAAMMLDSQNFSKVTRFLRECIPNFVDESKPWRQQDPVMIGRLLDNVHSQTNFFEHMYTPSDWPILHYLRKSWLPTRNLVLRRQSQSSCSQAYAESKPRSSSIIHSGPSHRRNSTMHVRNKTPTRLKTTISQTRRGFHRILKTESQDVSLSPLPSTQIPRCPSKSTPVSSKPLSLDEFRQFLGTLSPNLIALHSRFVLTGVRNEEDFCGLLELPVGERELFFNKDMALSLYEFRRVRTALESYFLNRFSTT
ncbi:hypothetical protein CERSUDRAFT_91775 [Gelatoporia subvermispora B]|uniref:Uncharacterized protein n=1 Tax=Ceriporiopsis subvermispora (strain B) TaxID=914234 RepID=M2R9D4_CERS8|nr:hypothetical protein CERSUDRAFT_91775 [Gelatoporia subvermispora B]